MLALRFFADSLEPNTVVYQGPATLDIRQALDIVIKDSEKADPEQLIRPLTRYRLASTITDGLARRIVPYIAAWTDPIPPSDRLYGPLGPNLRGVNERALREAAFDRDPNAGDYDEAFRTFFERVRPGYDAAIKDWSCGLRVQGLPSELSRNDRPPSVLSADTGFDEVVRRVQDAINNEVPALQERVNQIAGNLGLRPLPVIDTTRLIDRWLELTTGAFLATARSHMPQDASSFDRSRLKQDLDLLDLVLSINQQYGLRVTPSIARLTSTDLIHTGETGLEFTWSDAGRQAPPILRVNWKTEMDMDWRGQLMIRGRMTLDCSTRRQAKVMYDTFSRYCDPREWAASSAFWIESARCNESGTIVHPKTRSYRDGTKFFIREVVRGVVTYDLILGVTYNTDAIDKRPPEYSFNGLFRPFRWIIARHNSPKRTLTSYYLQDRRKTDLTRDEGYIEITLSPPDAAKGPYRVEGHYVKVLNFADNPYGGPGTTDLLAPSYVGSWVRVQLDLWLSRAEKEVKTKLGWNNLSQSVVAREPIRWITG